MFNISSFFSDRIIICSIGFAFTILSLYDLASESAILFPKNSPVASATSWTTFLETVFKAFTPASNNCFLHFLNKFLANDKNLYPLTYFHVFVSVKYCVISVY